MKQNCFPMDWLKWHFWIQGRIWINKWQHFLTCTIRPIVRRLAERLGITLQIRAWQFDTNKCRDNWKYERAAQQCLSWHWELVFQIESGCKWLNSELMLLNCSPSAIHVPTVKDDSCAVTQQTKSFGGLTIDVRLDNKEHARSVITKALGTWNHFRSKFSRRWGLTIHSQALLYRTVSQRQALYAFPGLGQKNTKDLQTFQNKVLRSILENWP